VLAPGEAAEWAEEGLVLARQSWRSWEAATEYFRATPQTLPLLGFADFRRWSIHGRELAETSSALAAAYYRASPRTLSGVPFSSLVDWVAMGRQLYKGTWRSASLAVQFFDASPLLFSQLSLEEAKGLVRFVDALCDRSYDLAAHCLGIAPNVLTPLGGEDRAAFLRFAEALAATGWADARAYLERGPDLLVHVHQSHRVRFLALAGAVARREGRQAFVYFADAARALSQVEGDLHAHVLSLGEDLVAYSPAAAMEFLKSMPQVLSRIPLQAVSSWQQEGRYLLAVSPEGGDAYFRLESSRAEEVLDSLSARVELGRVGEVLRLYCKALAGVDVAIHAADALAEKGIGWVDTEVPSTEGTGIYLPTVVGEFPDKARNFAQYKVYATHQTGHLEFGSFQFRFEGDGRVFPTLRQQVEQELADRRDEGLGPLTDMERFFDLFPHRRLAADLFAIVEDVRTDMLIEREYAGIVPAFRLVQGWEMDRRPPVEEMPLLQAMLENLVRAGLGAWERIRWPKQLWPLLADAIGLVQAVQQPGATVEDAAEATLRLYRLLSRVPNLPPELMQDQWQELDQESMPVTPMAGPGESMDLQFPDGSEMPYESPQRVEFRGEFKPELVQLLMRLRQEGQGKPTPLSPLSPEQLKALLDKSAEITLKDMAEGDLPESSDLFLTNLTKELTAQQERSQAQEVPGKERRPVLGHSGPDDERELSREPRCFYYDEWDFRAGDYKPRWCRLVEYTVAEGLPHFFDHTLSKHAALAAQTRRQFELLKPELFRKIKRLLDGEELDLDALIDFLVEREAGITPPGKIYWRRNKVERDIAVAVLLDMSASTDEEILKPERHYAQDDFDDDPRRYFAWWMARRSQELLSPPKRIIDVEKESLVLLIRALETIGDVYGVYGFSGYGRENVEFYVVKDMEELFGERIKKRIDKIAPVRSTRMGPAIRHVTSKLGQQESRVRILFHASDGRPQDHGYGRDRTEKEYAIHDTHKALLEAKRQGIVPFCLTVDRYGHDYLKQMCQDIGYAVVPDIEALPRKITTLYRRLTE
jgi:hypothetical protein